MLMRHGEAEELADGGDARRRLTSRGRTMAVRAGAMLRATGLVPSVAVASPFVRAQETLQGVLEASGVRLEVTTEPRLVPGAPAQQAVKALLSAAAGGGRVLAVGHNPCVTSVLSVLVGGSARMCFAVSAGDIAHVSVDPSEGSGVLLSYLPARVLDALAR
ncbi:MAG: SixA phosphatase family protein [Nannocystaceae bacterium]|nr:histidine phosphatase family protein [bacterium]